MNRIYGLVGCMVILGLLSGYSQDQSGFKSFKEEDIWLSAENVGNWVQEYVKEKNSLELRAELIYDSFSPGGRHFTFAFSLEGIPVMGNRVQLTLDPDGKLLSVLSDFDRVYAVSTESFQSAPYKEREISADYQEKTWEPRYEIQGGELHPILFEALPQRQESFVSSRSLMIDTTGRATVFSPDPCTRGQVRYGELFEDAEDAHDPVFDALMDTVDLLGLSYENGLFRLTGPYVEIADITAPDNIPATSSTGDFFFTRDQSGFEDVMAYYHIDRFQRYIQGLGYTNLQNRPIRIDSHGFIADQSEFVPLGDASYLRYGDGGVDDAEDADVLIHEYVHALVYDAARWELRSCERRGLEEGIADYFAAGYSRDINPFDWVNLFNWDGHNPFFAGRKAISSAQYPLEECTNSNIYNWGEIWTTAMMNIRNEIGGEVADRLMLQALYGLTEESGFVEAAELILEADQILNQGANQAWLSFSFCEQGIIQGSNCLSVSLEEDIFSLEEDYSFRRLPNSSSWLFRWEGDNSVTNEISFTLYNLLGEEVGMGNGSGARRWEKQFDLTPGIYIYRLSSPAKLLRVGKIGVRK